MSKKSQWKSEYPEKELPGVVRGKLATMPQILVLILVLFLLNNQRYFLGNVPKTSGRYSRKCCRYLLMKLSRKHVHDVCAAYQHSDHSTSWNDLFGLSICGIIFGRLPEHSCDHWSFHKVCSSNSNKKPNSENYCRSSLQIIYCTLRFPPENPHRSGNQFREQNSQRTVWYLLDFAWS